LEKFQNTQKLHFCRRTEFGPKFGLEFLPFDGHENGKKMPEKFREFQKLLGVRAGKRQYHIKVE